MTKTNTTILMSIYYILGLVGYFTDAISIFALIVFVLTLILLKKELLSNKLSIILYLIFILGFANCNLQLNHSDRLSDIATGNLNLTARITTIPTTNRPDRTKFYADVSEINKDGKLEKNINSKTLITIIDKKENLNKLEIGDTISINGNLSKPKSAKNPSQFDYANYLRNNHTFSTFFSEGKNWQIKGKANTPYWKFLQNINKTRNSIIQKHAANIKSPNIELLGGIVFGDDAVNPPDDIKKSFINSGLLHIIAASGMNVTLIFGIWFFISQRFRFHYKLSILTGIFLILFYSCMTGFGPSILRATIMLVFILLGKLIDRDADTIALLFFVALLMLLYDPAMINNVGFQLSFIVTFGLLLTCPIIFDKIENKYLNILASSCLVPLIAQIYAAPIQMFYFNTFSTYSIFANIAIIPFLTIISFLGFISSILALIPVVCIHICKIFDFILNPFLSGLINISNFFSNLPNSIIYTKHPSVVQIVIYFLFILSLTYLLKNGLKDKKAVSIALISLCTLIFLSLPIKNDRCEIIFFDMGNADSALIKTPKNEYILIDTGKAPYKTKISPAEQIIIKYLKDNGIKKLDALILTHFDSDHAGGSLGILKNIPVKKVYITDFYNKTRLSYEVFKYLKTNEIPYEIPKDNQDIIKESNFELLNVKNKADSSDPENEHSLIDLLICNNRKILFMADAGTAAYKNLKNANLNSIDLIKLGHHGGKNTINKKMIKDLKIKTAIISTGKNNYGHPSNSTLEILRDSGVKAIRTDYNNAIKISIGKNKMYIYTYKTNLKRFTR